ncbi:hypothetical protein OHA40_02515 [Nocardia sp. NBC_00508]|uniref:hypothetical protein n=1 Tax=Nocardia sp. NBC_00508 TaxID=2975992 RepID=UPI002E80F1E8|nr:hypothetical protein [Nocardia sp. NBC_00508]WUD67054.1 hypothetical protein OHA40_02515 [Nocardia sp. NBC_00508]
MGESLYVDPDLMHMLVTALSTAADQARRDLNELEDELARQGEPWGDDEPGRMIGEAYVPHVEKALEGYQNLIGTLDELSNGIAEVADSFDQQDHRLGNLIRDAVPDSMGPDVPFPVVSDPVGQNPDVPAAYPGSTGPLAESATGTQKPTTSAPWTSPAPSTAPSGNPSTAPQEQPAGYDSITEPTTAGQQPAKADAPAPQGIRDAVVDGLPNAPVGVTPRSAADPGIRQPRTAGPSTTFHAAGDATAATGKPTGTPWSRGPGGSTMRPNAAASPWSHPGPGSRQPGRVFGPEPARPGVAPADPARPSRKDKSRKAKPVAERDSTAAPTDPEALEAAQAMATRHGIQLAGFDTSGIGVHTVGEIAAALDDILGRYPFLEIGGIAIHELGRGWISQDRWDRIGSESEQARSGQPWLLLDRALVTNPARLAAEARAAAPSGVFVPGSLERPIYSAVVGELGRVLATMAGPRPRRSAQRALITEYRRISGPWAGRDTLATVVDGYRRWRNQLGGGSITGGRFHPQAALIASFAEVELRGEAACGPAKVLHLLMFESASRRWDSR